MASTGAMPRSTGLVGRESECELVDELVRRAVSGEGRALVVRGEAGIGKTALLDRAAGLCDAFLVLRATGVEAESDLAFAGLYGLTRPIVDKLSDLPAVQGAALSGALGLAPSTDADRLLVSAALLGLLAAAAEDQPVLCIVDDAQWLDRPSSDALVFAARRLRGERAVMLFAAREWERHRFEAAGLREVYLHGLDADSARILVSRRTGYLPLGVRERLLADAAGNPLALLELPSGLSDEQLAGEEALPDDIPLTPRLQAVFSQRIERLPEVTQAALRIAAAEDTGDAATVLRAVALSQLPGSVFDAAEHSDLIRVSHGKISFRHPLVRSALWDAATLNQRQSAHTALADALSGEENADRRVWHLAMATLAPDEEVAAALEASARRAQTRAAHSSAASALLRAAQLSADGERRIRRIAAAAQAAWDAGQPDRAREAIARALPHADGELKARILYLSGVIHARCDSLTAAAAQLREGAGLTSEPSLRLAMLLEACEAAAFGGQLQTVVELGAEGEALPALTDRDRLLQAMLMGFACALSGRHEQAQAQLTEAIRLSDSLDDPRGLVLGAMAASIARDLGRGLPYANRAVETARRRGLLADLAGALEWQAFELNFASRFGYAYAAAEEGYRLSLDVGRVSAWHLTNMATAEAALGRVDEARTHAEQALATAQRSGSNFHSDNAAWTLAFIDFSTGRIPDALDRLLSLTSEERYGTNPWIVMTSIPDAIEAAVRSGRSDLLGKRYPMLEAWTKLGPSEQRLAVLARCQALIEARPPEEAFEEALARAGALPPFQRARTELLYGEWLRRERRRQDARVHLRAALELFRGMGTRLFAERAEGELRATGETARKRDASTLDDLTPQEIQIASRVAEGLTNKEIASQLFLSPRTIDYHLRKVFSKLGIASRAELVRDGVPPRG
jgi:DNA-binding CsgD family transcriptional regulator/tetratricopeptide (TPR) repeat protein